MLNNQYTPSGFDIFGNYLSALSLLPNFSRVSDVVIFCDSAEDAQERIKKLRKQIKQANIDAGAQIFDENPGLNVVASASHPRLHVLCIPHDTNGGLETICVEVARNKLNENGDMGTVIEGWVNTFADSACDGWTTEKRDKLRLQAFISASFKKKPDMHFSQLFDITRGDIVPLNGEAFKFIRDFLDEVSAI